MSDQQQQEETESPEVEATGKLEDGRITAEAKFGGARLEVSWRIDEDEDRVDVLLNGAPQIAVAVVQQLLAQQEADHA